MTHFFEKKVETKVHIIQIKNENYEHCEKLLPENKNETSIICDVENKERCEPHRTIGLFN